MHIGRHTAVRSQFDVGVVQDIEFFILNGMLSTNEQQRVLVVEHPYFIGGI